MKLANNISLDWLSFTLAYSDKNMAHARSLGNGYKMIEQDFGRFQYNASTKMLDGAHIYYNMQRKNMGIHVALNAGSLALLDYRPLQLVNMIEDWGGTVKRLDLAFDDFGDLLNVDKMHVKILAGEVATRYRGVTRISGGQVGETEKMGDTVNLGSRKSDSFIRIYDKAAEQKARGEDLPEGVETWVRVELELKKDKAHAVARLLGQSASVGTISAGQEAANLLYGLLDFKEVDTNDVNKSRWPTSDWWMKFIRATGKRKLSLPKQVKSLDRAKKWFNNQVSATIAMIVLSELDDRGESGWDFIVRCVEYGEKKMNERQKEMLEEYNRQQKERAKAAQDALWREN